MRFSTYASKPLFSTSKTSNAQGAGNSYRRFPRFSGWLGYGKRQSVLDEGRFSVFSTNSVVLKDEIDSRCEPTYTPVASPRCVQKKKKTRMERIKLKLMHQLGIKHELQGYLAKHLSFFPLYFTDPLLERQFFQIIHLLFPMRMLFFGCGCFALNAVLWVYMTNLITPLQTIPSKTIYYYVLDQAQRDVFHAVHAFVCLCYLIFSFAPWIPGPRNDLELSSFVILGVVGVSVPRTNNRRA